MPYSSNMAVNKLIATNLSAIATFENERQKERQRQGIKVAKAAGKYIGRKTVITKKLIEEVRDLKEKKKLSITQIAKVTGRGRTTIYKVLKEELDYIRYNRLVKSSFISHLTRYHYEKSISFNSDVLPYYVGMFTGYET